MVPPPGFPYKMVQVKSAFTAENDDATLANYKALLHDHGKDDDWQTLVRESGSSLQVHDYHFRPEAYSKGRLKKSASKFIRPMNEVHNYKFCLFFICYFKYYCFFGLTDHRIVSSTQQCGQVQISGQGQAADSRYSIRQ
jgi:hypothetical protein